MKRYEKYKDSGIPWIGEIPSEWKASKIGFYYDTQLGKMLQPNPNGDKDTLERYLCAANIKKSGVSPEPQKEMWFSPADKAIYDVVLGDLLVVEGGDVGLSCIYRGQESIYIQNALHRVRENHDANNIYLAYWLEYLKGCGYMDLVCNKATIAHYTKDKLVNSPLVMPPVSVQQILVDYLDAKTAAIDTVIAKKQTLIALLYEKRTVTINDAVTKGLDSTVSMQDSGVVWLGKIPSHWSLLSNHQLFMERNEKSTQPDDVLLSVTKYLGVILQSQAEELNLATVAPADTTVGCKIVRKGDLVMNIMRAKDGSYGISSYDGVISPAYCIYHPRKAVNANYLFYLFKTPMYVEIFKNYSTGIAEHRMRLYPDSFFKIPAIVPPVEEQNAIVAFLNTKTKDIDDLIALTQQQIEKLKEYRQSVIAEVVTGKVAV